MGDALDWDRFVAVRIGLETAMGGWRIGMDGLGDSYVGSSQVLHFHTCL